MAKGQESAWIIMAVVNICARASRKTVKEGGKCRSSNSYTYLNLGRLLVDLGSVQPTNHQSS